jgi:hypothetical protein
VTRSGHSAAAALGADAARMPRADWLAMPPSCKGAYEVRWPQMSKGNAEPTSWGLRRCPSDDRCPMAR